MRLATAAHFSIKTVSLICLFVSTLAEVVLATHASVVSSDDQPRHDTLTNSNLINQRIKFITNELQSKPNDSSKEN